MAFWWQVEEVLEEAFWWQVTVFWWQAEALFDFHVNIAFWHVESLSFFGNHGDAEAFFGSSFGGFQRVFYLTTQVEKPFFGSYLVSFLLDVDAP